MYKVIHYFTDLEDNNHVYRVGDTYPREGMTPSSERVKSLLNGSNKRGVKLIEESGESASNAIIKASEVVSEKEATENKPKAKEAAKKPAKTVKVKKKTKEG